MAEEKAYREKMSDIILEVVNAGRRATCVILTKQYETHPPSKSRIQSTRRALNPLRRRIRDKRRILLVPVTEAFYKNNYDDGRILDEDEIEISLPIHSPTYGLVLASDYPSLYIAYYNRDARTSLGKQECRTAEKELAISQGFVKAGQLKSPVLKIDRIIEHMEFFGVKHAITPLIESKVMSEGDAVEKDARN